MELVAELIDMVKTNTKGLLCKETIEKFTKYWPGGCSYLVLRSKHMVPGDRPLIAIGYMYNMWKVLYFIVTDNAGRAQRLVFPIYLSILTNLLMLSFALLLFPP